MTKVELNPATNIMQAARQHRIAVNQGNISESVSISGELEQMAQDLCDYLKALSAELEKSGQALPLGWTEWLAGREKK